MKKITISRSKLKEFYLDKGLSTYDIAKIYQCDPTVIQKRLRDHDIQIRHPKVRVGISKEVLEDLYLNKGLSTYNIARQYNCSANTISRHLKEHEIKARKIEEVFISKNKLHDLYHNQKLSYSQIAHKYSCSPSIIFDKMKKYNIIPRSLTEATIIYPRYDFNGNKEEKAYLIGFRLGDLNVVQRWSTVVVKTNTTKEEQVRLIQRIFQNYGNVYTKKIRGVYYLSVNLNLTFKFLLPKKDEITSWILANKKYFASFLAGYTDAEGNIGVYSNRARYRLGSQDANLLGQVHSKLLVLNIHNTYRLEAKAGEFKNNKDFWRVYVNAKEDLLKLFELMGPYMKHEKRCKDLKKAEENIFLRIRRKK